MKIIPFVIGAIFSVIKRLLKGLEDLDHLNYSIIEKGQNIEKSAGDLRRVAVTQIPVKDRQLKLV